MSHPLSGTVSGPGWKFGTRLNVDEVLTMVQAMVTRPPAEWATPTTPAAVTVEA